MEETTCCERRATMDRRDKAIVICLVSQRTGQERELGTDTTDQGTVVMVDLFDIADTVVAIAYQDGHQDDDGQVAPMRPAFPPRRLRHRERLTCGHGSQDRRQEGIHE